MSEPYPQTPSSLEEFDAIYSQQVLQEVQTRVGHELTDQKIDDYFSTLSDEQAVDTACIWLRNLPLSEEAYNLPSTDHHPYTQIALRIFANITNSSERSSLFYQGMSAQLEQSLQKRLTSRPAGKNSPTIIEFAATHTIYQQGVKPEGVAAVLALSEQLLDRQSHHAILKNHLKLQTKGDLYLSLLDEGFTDIGVTNLTQEIVHRVLVKNIEEQETATYHHDLQYEEFREEIDRELQAINDDPTAYQRLISIGRIRDYNDPTIREYATYAGAARVVSAAYKMFRQSDDYESKNITNFLNNLPKEYPRVISIATNNLMNWINDNQAFVYAAYQMPRRLSKCKFHLLSEISESISSLIRLTSNSMTKEEYLQISSIKTALEYINKHQSTLQ